MMEWKLVPVEPTPEMLKAVSVADCHNFELSWAEGYKAMLNAAPAPDVQPAIYPEEAREMGLEEVPYYTHPPAEDVQELVRALKWIEKRCNEGLFEDGFFHQEHWKAAHDAGACARAYLKKWEGK